MGGRELSDEGKTKEPDLVLIKPNVSVMSKTELRLMNPKGWYCLKGSVAVLGTTRVQLNCKASMTASAGGANVLGANDAQSGITVMGSSRIEKVGCD
jgi:hypothetical protein